MADDRDRANFVRRLVGCRCPELTLDDLELAFGGSEGIAFADDAPDPNASDLAEVAGAIADAIEALEERLTILEQDVPRRVH